MTLLTSGDPLVQEESVNAFNRPQANQIAHPYLNHFNLFESLVSSQTLIVSVVKLFLVNSLILHW